MLEPLIVIFTAKWWNCLNAKSGWQKVTRFPSSIPAALPLNWNGSPWLLKSIAPKMLLATVRKMKDITSDEGEELFGLLGFFSQLFPIPQYISPQLQRQHPNFSPMRKKTEWRSVSVLDFSHYHFQNFQRPAFLSPRNALKFWAMWKHLTSQLYALQKKCNL